MTYELNQNGMSIANGFSFALLTTKVRAHTAACMAFFYLMIIGEWIIWQNVFVTKTIIDSDDDELQSDEYYYWPQIQIQNPLDDLGMVIKRGKLGPRPPPTRCVWCSCEPPCSTHPCPGRICPRCSLWRGCCSRPPDRGWSLPLRSRSRCEGWVGGPWWSTHWSGGHSAGRNRGENLVEGFTSERKTWGKGLKDSQIITNQVSVLGFCNFSKKHQGACSLFCPKLNIEHA